MKFSGYWEYDFGSPTPPEKGSPKIAKFTVNDLAVGDVAVK